MTRRSAVRAALVAAALGALTACHTAPSPAPEPSSAVPSAIASSTVASAAVSSVPTSRTASAVTPPSARRTPAGPPAYDHVVVVVLENHSFAQLSGDPDARWIHALAAGGAVFTNSHGIAHPSQPNYLALFSGSTQGVSGDGCPVTVDAPNLATALLRHGRTFTGYSEGLPAVGSTDCWAGAYGRKHNPWSDFTGVPPAVNRPFADFPADPAALPRVSFVVPDLDHDMHDGSVAAGDAWLRAHLDRYAGWARTHRSLLVLTADEDDGSADNRILTVFSGDGVRPGRYGEHLDHYGVLSTVAAAAGVPAPGRAAAVAPVRDVWTG